MQEPWRVACLSSTSPARLFAGCHASRAHRPCEGRGALPAQRRKLVCGMKARAMRNDVLRSARAAPAVLRRSARPPPSPRLGQ
eukprot:15431145-Alexandrium_andersonii.AAC.1